MRITYCVVLVCAIHCLLLTITYCALPGPCTLCVRHSVRDCHRVIYDCVRQSVRHWLFVCEVITVMIYFVYRVRFANVWNGEERVEEEESMAVVQSQKVHTWIQGKKDKNAAKWWRAEGAAALLMQTVIVQSLSTLWEAETMFMEFGDEEALKGRQAKLQQNDTA